MTCEMVMWSPSWKGEFPIGTLVSPQTKSTWSHTLMLMTMKFKGTHTQRKTTLLDNFVPSSFIEATEYFAKLNYFSQQCVEMKQKIWKNKIRILFINLKNTWLETP